MIPVQGKLNWNRIKREPFKYCEKFYHGRFSLLFKVSHYWYHQWKSQVSREIFNNRIEKIVLFLKFEKKNQKSRLTKFKTRTIASNTFWFFLKFKIKLAWPHFKKIRTELKSSSNGIVEYDTFKQATLYKGK